ncbi:MAG TPA: hypothetical protein VKA38_05970 [Draconibacterium sp.]|nr:hypothetical protein [Draconibacterium sp.]
MENRYPFVKAIYPLAGLILLIILLSACKKDTVANNAGKYEMSFKANGASVKYDTENALVATFNQTNNQYIAIFSGYDTNSNMNLSVYDDKAISETNYSGYTVSGIVTTGVLMGYQDDSGTLYTQPGADVAIRVSSISASAVSGTFSGTLKATGKPDMVITDGKFNLKRLN